MKDYLAEPPFVPPTRPISVWTMSQRAGSLSYQIFATGFSLFVYVVFIWLCDIRHMQVGFLLTLGTNALAAYVLHGMVARAIRPYAPENAPLWFGLLCFALFLAICYGFLRFLEKRQLYLRL